jgi:peptidoglycan glycosyltransferase
MNKPIARLFLVSMLMFAALVGATSWWTVVRADSLNRDHPTQNKRDLLRSLRIKRGAIRASDGLVIARSVKDSEGVYSRIYPQRQLFGQPVGYSFTATGQQTGLEAFYNHDLSGTPGDADTLIGELTGRASPGKNLQTTLDPKAQKVATDAIAAAGGNGGSAVALDPKTGAVKVMVSVPGLDPDAVRTAKGLAAANRDSINRPLVNRAVQFGYAPGSTFKVVTLTAAIDSGRYQLNSQVDATNDVKISGVPLQNDFNESFGNIDLKTALTKSVNTAYAQVAEKLGKPLLREYMERFGFDSKPRLDYPSGTMSASGEHRNGDLLPPTSRFVDVGRMGIGQDKLTVTPLQMAQVAAAVANGGTLMKPHLADRFVDSDGRTTKRIEPEVQSHVMSAQTAAAVRDAMVSVVQFGTGTKAQIDGVQVAGKTGTAETEIGQNTKNKLWFIAFAPAQDPKVAVAVTVDNVVGFGGDVVAPIAKQIIEELLND